jgi:hypothetical protein
MLNPFQRFVIAVARSAGYQPVGPAGIRRLCALQGEFRRSISERIVWYVFEGLALGWGSWMVGSAVSEYVRWGVTEWSIGAMGGVIVSIGLSAIVRNGRWYEFNNGLLTVLRYNHQPIWQENLVGLTSATLMRGRGGFVTTLVLRWPGHTRRLELFRSLEAALSTEDSDR